MGNARHLVKFGAMLALISSFVNAFAAEGVIEINQAKINAVGGGTYTITQPGSYRLTSNLTQPNATTHVITINADDVSIDLNGFAISGVNNCSTASGAFSTCTASGTGVGVFSARRNSSVSNGTVTRMAGSCVYSFNGAGNTSMSVDRVRVSNCGNYGIFVDRGSISNSSAATSGYDGLYVSEGTVSNSIARDNNQNGISARAGKVISSVAQANGSTGISARQVQNSHSSDNKSVGIESNLAIGNYAGTNGSFGISSTGLFTQNSLQCNIFVNGAGDCLGTATQKSGGVSIPVNSNLCNGTPC
jgi:hypothetical protein